MNGIADRVSEVWAALRQLVTSRTIFGVVIMLFAQFGIDLPDGDSIASAGDSILTAMGALMSVIGYLDRRPKPASAAVVIGS